MAQIRLAAPGDALAMARIHVTAVHALAAGHYPAGLLDEWSTPDGAYQQRRLLDSIAAPAEVVLVAEDATGVVGFASCLTASWEIRAVYVAPAVARRGIGSALLGALEEAAAARGIARLELNASLNAEGFYRVNGYRVLERRTCLLPSGRRMPCLRMGKFLSAPPSRP